MERYPSSLPLLSNYRNALEIAQYQDEECYRSGEPNGKGREYIPLSARIVVIADVFDALTSERLIKVLGALKKH
jgi:HD-GYP domain-containing protein (c-di-GMP phosphodiesterase class II)